MRREVRRITTMTPTAMTEEHHRHVDVPTA